MGETSAHAHIAIRDRSPAPVEYWEAQPPYTQQPQDGPMAVVTLYFFLLAETVRVRRSYLI